MQDLLAPHQTTASAAPNTAPRLDLYRPIHQALRAEMTRILTRLGALDIGNPGECRQVLGSATRLLALIDSHLHHEEAFVHPALHAADPGCVADTEAEHARHRATMQALNAAMDQLLAQPSDERAAQVYRAFALFVAENLEHMHEEEVQVNALLWAHYSDAELVSIHDQLIASIPPAELFEILVFMLPALNPMQRAGMLAGMRASAPPQAFQGVLALAKDVLDGQAWLQLQDALVA
jgi:hemerythrin-like domain-containing protein